MQSFASKKQIALNLLEECVKVADFCKKAEQAAELREEAQHLRAGELNLAVCGECKMGKSSLADAFLEEPGLCPVDAPVATNAITKMRFGETERIEVVRRDKDGKMTADRIQRAQIAAYVTEQANTGNWRGVGVVEIQLNNPKLKDGLVVIDTPGVGGLNVAHTAATYSVIPHADAVLFVSAALERLTMPELQFAAKIAKHKPRLLHVLTKRDSAGNWEEVLGDNRRKLAEYLKRPESEIKGVAVSSKLKLEYMADPDEETLELSGFLELERAIWDLLGVRSDILLTRAQDHLLPAIAQLRLPLEVEREGLTSSSAGELNALDDELQEKIRRGEELTSGTPFWVTDLGERTANLQTDCIRLFGDEFAGVERALDDYLKIDDYLKDPDKLADMLTADCNSAFAVVVESIETELGEIATYLRQKTALGIEGGSVTASGPGRIMRRGLTAPKHSRLQSASQVGRSVTMNSLGVGVSGTILGGVIGGILGSVAPGAGTVVGIQAGMLLGSKLGTIMGAIFGLKRGISELGERDRAWLRQNLGQAFRMQLEGVKRTVSAELMKVLISARSEIQQSLMREIQREQKACKDAAAALAKARQEKSSNVAARLRELGIAIKQLANLEEAAGQLVDAPPAETTTASAAPGGN